MKTYKTATLAQSLFPTIKALKKKYDNPINSLKMVWNQIIPDWANNTEPYMIKNKVLFIKTNSNDALILQFRQNEFLEIVDLILNANGNTNGKNNIVEKIKILKI